MAINIFSAKKVFKKHTAKFFLSDTINRNLHSYINEIRQLEDRNNELKLEKLAKCGELLESNTYHTYFRNTNASDCDSFRLRYFSGICILYTISY
jgi:hypothetical protein